MTYFMSCEDCACLRAMQPCEACSNYSSRMHKEYVRERIQMLSSFAVLQTLKERGILKNTTRSMKNEN